MLSPQILALAFTLAPSLVSAGLFPSDSLVKVIDAKGFKKAMKANETSMVAFYAPWCGHCQQMAPEYSKTALGLYPLIPFYAVDCDAAKNKQLCAEQGVQGFPTVKLFPRGKSLPPVLFEDRRTASAFYYFAIRKVPKAFTKVFQDSDIVPWAEKHQDKPRAFLLRKDKKTPLLWQVLCNKYQGQVEFGTIPDRKGRVSVKMGLEAGEKKVSKVLIYPPGSAEFIVYDGIQKLESLSNFLEKVIDGTADLSAIIEETKAEEFVVDDKELEIERQQEAQRIALLHGGFSNLIDFEKAIKDGAGADYHGSQGYSGYMGGIPEHLKKKKSSDPPSTTINLEKGETATPPPEQKEAKIVEEPISKQVTLENKNDAPVGCQGKDNAPSTQEGEQGSCRPKDEL